METKSFICINCPLGCPLTVTVFSGRAAAIAASPAALTDLILQNELGKS